MALMLDRSRISRIPIFLIPAAVLTGIDQCTKQLAVSFLKGRPSVVLIEGVLELAYVENRGAAFGILYGRQYIFVVLAAAVSLFAFVYFLMLPARPSMVPLGGILISIVSGAIGNLIDRLRLGYVVDFIYFSLIDFPVFNFADILVTCSAFLMVFLFIFYYKDEDLLELPLLGSGRKA